MKETQIAYMSFKGGGEDLADADVVFRGRGIEMLTVADMGEGGVKNHVKSADVLYGWSLIYYVSPHY